MAIEEMPAGLSAYQTERTERKLEAVSRSIEELRARGVQVSFRNVADQSGVSRSTLYRNRAIRAVVDRAREEQAPQVDIAELQRSVLVLQAQVESLSHRHLAQRNYSYAGIIIEGYRK